MSEIVFAKTRHDYGSYQDFWKLVELSGFKTCYVDEIDLASALIYITTPCNGELAPAIDAAKARLNGASKSARIALWQLERPDENLPPGPTVLETRNEQLLKMVDEIWVSDRHFASLDPKYSYVTLASHPSLRLGGPEPIRYDLCHMSARFPRRQPILDKIFSDWKGRIGPIGWGAERAKTINSSRAMINVHKTPAPIGEPLRFALAAAFRIPLITETLSDPWPMVDGVHFISSGANTLRQKVRESLARKDLREFGERLYALLCVEKTFGSCVLEAAAKLGVAQRTA